MNVDAAPRRGTTLIAAGLAMTAMLFLAVMLVVRRDDYAAAGALIAGLVTTSLVGAFVASRRPGHPCGWLLLGVATIAAATVAATDYVQSSVAAEEPYPLTVWVGWTTTWSAYPALALGVLLLLTFPAGRLPSGRWRLAAGAAMFASGLAAAAAAVMPGPLPIAGTLANPLGLEGAEGPLEALKGVSGLVAAVVLIAAVGRLVLRYHRATGLERDQLRMLARALPVTAAGLVGAAAASGPLNEASFYFAVVGLTAVPVAIGWAVVRHRLFDLEVLLNRALVYGPLTLLVGALYVAIVTALGQALRQSAELGVSVIATAVVAVAFAPLRDGIQRAADRLMYGDRADPYAAVSGLGRRLEAAAAPEEALPLTAETLGRTLKMRAVAIDVLRDGQLESAADWGTRGPDAGAERFDLIHGRELVGQLVVWPRPTETLSVKDRLLVVDLCRPVAVVAHAAAVRRELHLSRQRLVTAREEERRRLRADLHDGLGPELAGVGFGLGAARNMLNDGDPERAAALLVELQQQVRGAVTQVRSLVDGLAPAVDQLGFVGALRDGAGRLAASASIDIELDLPDDLPQQAAAIEVAAYRIAMEAVTNVVRHAEARRCVVRLRDAGGLCLEVTDDGIGLPATVIPGVGLSSMRQRAEELGGTWSIEPAASGGTNVAVRFPPA